MSMKKVSIIPIVLIVVLVCGIGRASAASVSGSMAVTLTVSGSMSFALQTDASGLSLANSGGASVTAAFGTMSAYGGSVPTGVTRTVNAPTSWQVSTPFDVLVQLANQTSSNYTLTAQLQSSDSTNTWTINSMTVTSASTTTLTSTGSYGTEVYTFNLTIPFSEPAGGISNTINFVATAN